MVATQSWLLIVADICWKKILCFLCRKERWVEKQWDDPPEWWAMQGLRRWRNLGTSLVSGIFCVSLRITACNSCRAQFPLPGYMWVGRGWSVTSTAHLSPPVPKDPVGGRRMDISVDLSSVCPFVCVCSFLVLWHHRGRAVPLITFNDRYLASF